MGPGVMNPYMDNNMDTMILLIYMDTINLYG